MGPEFKSLSRKGLFFILLASTVITTVMTCFSTWLDYRREIGGIEEVVNQIGNTNIQPLALAVWNFDDKALDTQVTGILNFKEVVSIEVLDNDGKTITNKTTEKPSLNNIIHDFELIEQGDATRVIGRARIEITQQFLFEKIAASTVTFFCLQGLKTLLVSFIILLIFDRLIIKHLKKLTQTLNQLELDALDHRKPMTLDRKPQQDELEVLVDTYNRMMDRLQSYSKENRKHLRLKERQLETQKAKAINASRLASLGEMAAGIAHEINNPMTIVVGQTEKLERLAERGSLDQDTIDKSVKKIKKTSLRVSTIVNGLLTFARAGESRPVEPVDLGEVLNNTLDLCREKFKSHRVELQVSGFDSAQYILGQSVQLSQVILNLLNNAFDAVSGQKNRWVKISLTTDKDQHEIRVMDSGPGIPKAVQANIMEPFFTTKEVGQGTGLGLSISRGLIEDFGGTLTLDTAEAETTFVITLPAFKDPSIGAA